jgi:hypothetical protein
MVVHSLSYLLIPALHHLLLNGLPEPPHRSSSPPVAWGSQPYGSRKPGVTDKFVSTMRLINLSHNTNILNNPKRPQTPINVNVTNDYED